MRRSTRGRMAGVIAAGLISNATAAPALAAELPQPFVHHVYFWLKQPDQAGDRAKLVEGLRSLTGIKTIKAYHIGAPAETDRPVIDQSYAVSWMLAFDSKADQDAYQDDPIHLKFVADYSQLWARVIVYDSEAIE